MTTEPAKTYPSAPARNLDMLSAIEKRRKREVIFFDISAERDRQLARWGEQHHPDGTGQTTPIWIKPCDAADVASTARLACQAAAKLGCVTWRDILTEEFYEAIAEDDARRLRAELVQVAAVAAAWIEDIDSRDGAA